MAGGLSFQVRARSASNLGGVAANEKNGQYFAADGVSYGKSEVQLTLITMRVLRYNFKMQNGCYYG
jgi:hypothetical protein